MSSQITGLSQAQRNANDGISVAQTAEGALNQVNDNLQRIRELSVQAQNGTNSDADLESIQNEIGQRLNEINRISEETDFNGVKVLQEDNSLKIQVGAKDGETISIDLKQINAETLGLDSFSVSGAKAATESDLKSIDNLEEIETVDGVTKYAKTINTLATAEDVLHADVMTEGAVGTGGNVTVDGKTYTNTAADTYVLADANQTAGVVASELTPATGFNEVTVNFAGGSTNLKVRIDDAGNLTNEAGEKLKLSGTGTNTTLSVAGDGDTQATISDVTTQLAGAAATTDKITDGNVSYVSDGSAIDKTTTLTTDQMLAEIEGKVATVKDDDAGTNTYTISAEGNVSKGGASTYVTAGTTTLVENNGGYSANDTYYVQEDGTVNTQQDGKGDTVYMEDKALTTAPENKSTANPLEALDSALSQVDALRSDLGAIQNRFDSAITNLSTTETNLSAARSRIEDADYATEVANMTRAQIL